MPIFPQRLKLTVCCLRLNLLLAHKERKTPNHTNNKCCIIQAGRKISNAMRVENNVRCRGGSEVKSLSELAKEVEESILKDDLVKAIIFKSEQKKIPKYKACLQQAFFSLKKKFPDLFAEFIFDESGITPFSDELESVLFRLEASDALHTLNPTYKDYIITNSLESFERSYNKFSSDREEIDSCARFFSEFVSRQADHEK